MELQEYKGFKVGDIVIISEKPKNWASLLSKNSPLIESKITYPFVGKIERLKNDNSYTAANIGDFGFDISYLYEKGNIKLLNKRIDMITVIDDLKKLLNEA